MLEHHPCRIDCLAHCVAGDAFLWHGVDAAQEDQQQPADAIARGAIAGAIRRRLARSTGVLCASSLSATTAIMASRSAKSP